MIVHALRGVGVDAVLHRSAGCSRWRSGTSDRQRLLLARDRLGIKPLYYAWDGRRISFGSELRAVLEASRWIGESTWTRWPTI